jgi:hypothetical protein
VESAVPQAEAGWGVIGCFAGGDGLSKTAMAVEYARSFDRRPSSGELRQAIADLDVVRGNLVDHSYDVVWWVDCDQELMSADQWALLAAMAAEGRGGAAAGFDWKPVPVEPLLPSSREPGSRCGMYQSAQLARPVFRCVLVTGGALLRCLRDNLLRVVDGLRAALRLALMRVLSALARRPDAPSFVLVLLATSRRFGHRTEPSDCVFLPSCRYQSSSGRLPVACS